MSPQRDTGWSRPHGCIPRQESERAASGQHRNCEFLERLGSRGKRSWGRAVGSGMGKDGVGMGVEGW